MSSPRTYLGDGVYAALDPFGTVTLTVEGASSFGFAPPQTIVLAPETLRAFREWMFKEAPEHAARLFVVKPAPDLHLKENFREWMFKEASEHAARLFVVKPAPDLHLKENFRD